VVVRLGLDLGTYIVRWIYQIRLLNFPLSYSSVTGNVDDFSIRRVSFISLG
jgi:hypothetical protein